MTLPANSVRIFSWALCPPQPSVGPRDLTQSVRSVGYYIYGDQREASRSGDSVAPDLRVGKVLPFTGNSQVFLGAPNTEERFRLITTTFCKWARIDGFSTSIDNPDPPDIMALQELPRGWFEALERLVAATHRAFFFSIGDDPGTAIFVSNRVPVTSREIVIPARPKCTGQAVDMNRTDGRILTVVSVYLSARPHRANHRTAVTDHRKEMEALLKATRVPQWGDRQTIVFAGNFGTPFTTRREVATLLNLSMLTCEMDMGVGRFENFVSGAILRQGYEVRQVDILCTDRTEPMPYFDSSYGGSDHQAIIVPFPFGLATEGSPPVLPTSIPGAVPIHRGMAGNSPLRKVLRVALIPLRCIAWRFCSVQRCGVWLSSQLWRVNNSSSRSVSKGSF